MSENGENCQKQRPQMSRFHPQPKYIQFTATEEEREQEIFTFEKHESENFYLFCLDMRSQSGMSLYSKIKLNESIY